MASEALIRLNGTDPIELLEHSEIIAGFNFSRGRLPDMTDGPPSPPNQPDFRKEIAGLMSTIPAVSQNVIAARCAWRVVPLIRVLWTNENQFDDWWVKEGDGYLAGLVFCILAGVGLEIPEDQGKIAIASAQRAADRTGAFGIATNVAAMAAALLTDAPNASAESTIYLSIFTADNHLAQSIDISAKRMMELVQADVAHAIFKGPGFMEHPLWDNPIRVQDRTWIDRISNELLQHTRGSSLADWFLMLSLGESPYAQMLSWFEDWIRRQSDRPTAGTNPPTVSADNPDAETRRGNAKPDIQEFFIHDTEAEDLTPTFEKCKEALRKFLGSKKTEPPMTVSLEAPWGGGKSSILHKLRIALEADGIPTVWFNPCKHEAGKTLWAAFAVAFERQMAAPLAKVERWVIRAWLAIWRMNRVERLLLGLRLFSWIVLGALGMWMVLLLPPTDKMFGSTIEGSVAEWIKIYAPWLTLLFPLWGLATDLAKNLGSPIKLDMVGFLNNNPHEDGVDDLHRFHEDFARMMWAYMPGNIPWVRFMTIVRGQTDPHWPGQLRYVFHAVVVIVCRAVRRWHYKHLLGCPEKLRDPLPPRWRRDRIVVFIDDLDRCEAPKAADLLMSLHQMLNVSEKRPIGKAMRQHPPGVICVLAMDSEKVAAALATKHEKLLPLLLEPEDKDVVFAERALGFGHEFLEKFIQLKLHLPPMRGHDQDEYLRNITGWTVENQIKAATTALHQSLTHSTASPGASPVFSVPDRPPTSEEVAQQKRDTVKRLTLVDELLGDGYIAHHCAVFVAKSLGHNPRRLKQFVNLLRLRLFLAATTSDEASLDLNTLRQECTKLADGKIGAHQIAKLVALDLADPMAMAKVREMEPSAMIAELGKAFTKEGKPALHALVNWEEGNVLYRLTPKAMQAYLHHGGAPK